MYAYCGNNPVNGVDTTGEAWFLLAVVLVCTMVCLTSSTPTLVPEEEFKVDDTVHNITDYINMYETGKGKYESGKLNVEFFPEHMVNGEYNPQFIIYGSAEIDKTENMRAVLEYIIASDYYSQDIYRRTIDSMMIEWDAHNDVYWWSGHSRVYDTNFDRNAEGMLYKDYWNKAFGEFFGGNY